MADIKTRASLRTIKTIDRTQTLAQKTKEGVQGLNREAEQTQSEGYESANEYADDQLESKEKCTILIRANFLLPLVKM